VKIDTGAQINVIPEACYELLGAKLVNRSVIIKSFGGSLIRSKGKINVTIENKESKLASIFEVIEYEGIPILGYKDSKLLKYEMCEVEELQETVMKNKFIQKYSSVFSGIGSFPSPSGIT